jgi:hypothetical protein
MIDETMEIHKDALSKLLLEYNERKNKSSK